MAVPKPAFLTYLRTHRRAKAGARSQPSAPQFFARLQAHKAHRPLPAARGVTVPCSHQDPTPSILLLPLPAVSPRFSTVTPSRGPGGTELPQPRVSLAPSTPGSFLWQVRVCSPCPERRGRAARPGEGLAEEGGEGKSPGRPTGHGIGEFGEQPRGRRSPRGAAPGAFGPRRRSGHGASPEPRSDRSDLSDR